MEILTYILSPPFLAKNIYLIAVIFSAILLVVFSNFINENLVFPVADYFKQKTAQKLSNKKNWLKKYTSEGIATVLFIIYCYFGSYFLTEYFIAPVLNKFKEMILIVVILVFFITSYAINDSITRRKLFGF